MIYVYYAGAGTDKDRFLFDEIAKKMPADTILLVPDQFTLQAERNAFAYLNTDTLLELEIMSRMSFTSRIISTEGAPAGTPVDKYGRFMLLASLMLGTEKNEGIFAAVNKKRSFISLLNDLISEMKQYEITPAMLQELSGDFSDEEILQSKLLDISEIFESYEASIAGKFVDTEDYIKAVTERIYKSRRVAGSEFFVDGFDYMSPKMLAQLEAIACTAKNLVVVLTCEDEDSAGAGAALNMSAGDTFAVSVEMRRRLKEIAAKNGIEYREERIPDAYRLASAPKVKAIEASDFYTEAESIAIEVTKLVREEGLRYRDIVIICNDAEKRGSIFSRVFENYEIPLFIDRKRSITHDPAIEFIFAMLDIVRKNRQFGDVFRMIKTGYSPVDDATCEELENYCKKYHIKSGRWKKDFIYGISDEGEEKLERMNAARCALDAFITSAETLFKDKRTVREKAEAIYLFLTDTARMPEKIDLAKAALEARGQYEYAGSVSQVWSTIINLLDQMVEVIGDEEISHEDFAEILKEGFEEVEIGLLPPNNDQVIYGTMQRTRTGNVKALFIAGANEGVLPESGTEEGIFSDDEKELISERKFQISKTRELRDREQNLAMYKNINKASDYLCVSYAKIDTGGSELAPSELVGYIKENCEGAWVQIDYPSLGDAGELAQNLKGALPHLTSALREYMDTGKIDDTWKAAALASMHLPSYKTALSGLFFTPEVEDLEKKIVRELYGRGSAKEIILSTSALEKYSRCPFSFFITYGLKPEEERSFDVDMRSIGEIYHDCLRMITDALTDSGMAITDPHSRWMNVSEEECRSMISDFADDFASRYREGVFEYSEREKYMLQRIKEICYSTAWIMIEQVRCGNVRAIYFEERFGRRKDALFPPVEIDLGIEGSVYIEGIIDRVDVINTGGEDYIRVIDYKSGTDKFDMGEVLSGYRLQLMVYLKGAMGAVKGSKPAGVFYFSIKEQNIDVSEISDGDIEDKVRETVKKNARLDGVLLDDESVIYSMDSGALDGSSVLPVSVKKDGTFYGKSLLSGPEFSELIGVTDENIKNCAAGLVAGLVDAEPKKSKDRNKDACTYCAYSSICLYKK